jgi:hypothetical protein
MIRYDEQIPLILQENEIDEALWVSWKDALDLLSKSKQYLILIEAIKIAIIKKFKIKNIFSQIKPHDRIYIKYNDCEYTNDIISNILPNINQFNIKYYLGSYILIDMFVNNYDFLKISIFKLKSINNLYYINGYNSFFNMTYIDNPKLNLNYIISKFNGLEIKNYYNNIKFNFGIIWNSDIYKILLIL